MASEAGIDLNTTGVAGEASESFLDVRGVNGRRNVALRRRQNQQTPNATSESMTQCVTSGLSCGVIHRFLNLPEEGHRILFGTIKFTKRIRRGDSTNSQEPNGMEQRHHPSTMSALLMLGCGLTK